MDNKIYWPLTLTAVAMVPESQLWTLQEPHRAKIARGLAWAARAKTAETDLDALVRRALTVPRARGRTK